jgi:hypothetical protein
MGRIPYGVCTIGPFSRHTHCATSDDRETEVVTLRPLL